MDKYELSIKEDKIKKHAEKKDYATAAKIADTIDWSKVKNIKMLTLVSQIYERVKNYTEAKNVLLLAYDRVPVGRRMLYKLCELCVKAGNLDEAEDFFEEFQEIAPNDISKLILAYQIEAARGEPLEKLITILELYRKNEFEEKWAYELAYLYHKAGRVKECVQLCNEIILWFSVGPYVDKALNLKMQYEPLTPVQQEKLVNKKKFEERIKVVEREFAEKYSQETLEARGSAEDPTLKAEGAAEAAAAAEPTEEILMEEMAEEEENEEAMIPEAQFHDMENDLAQAVREAVEAGASETEEPDLMDQTREIVKEEKEAEPSAEEKLGQTADFMNEVSAALAASVAATEKDEDERKKEPVSEPEADAAEEEAVSEPEADATEKSQASESEADATEESQASESEADAMEEEADSEPEPDTSGEEPEETLDAETEPDSEETAPEAQEKPVQEEMPKKSSVVKMPIPKSVAKQMVREEREKKAEEPVYEETSNMEFEETVNLNVNQLTCVVVDEPDGPERMKNALEKLKKTHEVLGTRAGQAAKISGGKLNGRSLGAVFAKLGGRDLIIDRAADMDGRSVSGLVSEIKNPSETRVVLLVDEAERMDMLLGDHPELDMLCVYLEDDSQMSLDDFVESAKEYAKQEECVIDETAGLALYAAAERLRGDGVKLSEEEAKNLIDDVIDRAEHRGIKGLFGSKYDKNGYLILKEQFFKNI